MARTRIGVVPRPPVWQHLSLVNFLAHHPGRRWSVASAALAGVWALFLLPPQLVEWGDAPAWAEALNDSPFYRGVDALRETLGLHDAYVASGSAIALSVVLVWWATGPSLRWLGWSGHVFSWVLLSLAPVTVLSYASCKETAPLHALWARSRRVPRSAPTASRGASPRRPEHRTTPKAPSNARSPWTTPEGPPRCPGTALLRADATYTS